MTKRKLTLRCLCEGAIMLALAQVLGYIKLWQLPNGGSVTLSMLPIFVFCIRWGFGPGLLVSFAFGLLQLFLDVAYSAGWQSIIGDYLLAFAVMGFAGLFKEERHLLGVAPRHVPALPRSLCHGRDALGRIYAGRIFRHDHDLSVDLLRAL